MSRTTFPYKVTKKIEDEKEVTLEVKSLSDVNEMITVVVLPKQAPKEINGDGELKLGMASTLKGGIIVAACDVQNIAEEVEDISIGFYLNNEEIVKYSKPRKEENRPMITIDIDID